LMRSAQFRPYIETLNVLVTKATAGARTRSRSSPTWSQPAQVCVTAAPQPQRAGARFGTALRALRRAFQHHSAHGLGDHIIIGGFPSICPALKPFFMGEDGLLPKPEDFAPYAGFLDARIRYDRVKTLLRIGGRVSRKNKFQPMTSSRATP